MEKELDKFIFKFKVYCFFFNFFTILVMSKDILDYLCFFCLKEDVVIIGHNLYLHILYYFILTIILIFIVYVLGFGFFVCYFLGCHSFLKYYLRSFKLYIDPNEVDFFVIEIPTDLVYRLLIFFFILSIFFSWISTKLRKRRFITIFVIFFFFFFFIPTLKYVHLIIGSYLPFEIFFLLQKFYFRLNRGGFEPPTLPLSGVRSSN